MTPVESTGKFRAEIKGLNEGVGRSVVAGRLPVTKWLKIFRPDYHRQMLKLNWT